MQSFLQNQTSEEEITLNNNLASLSLKPQKKKTLDDLKAELEKADIIDKDNWDKQLGCGYFLGYTFNQLWQKLIDKKEYDEISWKLIANPNPEFIVKLIV